MRERTLLQSLILSPFALTLTLVMHSSLIARTSAVILAAGGVPLLFAADSLLPALVPTIPPAAGWLGQLMAAAWLSIALFNWSTRNTTIGGIYGKPAVMLNLTLYLVSGLGLLKAPAAPLAVRVVAVLLLAMAALYGRLMFGGPMDRTVTTAARS